MNLPFEQAVAPHGETMLRVRRAVLGLGVDADDTWSETFLAALKAWPELDENTNVEALLVCVAHRKAIDITRQLSRRARMVPPTPPEELPESENGVEGASISNCDIWELVAALPLRQRQAIAYHFLGGLSYREAADGMKKLRKSYRHD